MHLWHYIKTKVRGDFQCWNVLSAEVRLWLNNTGSLAFQVPGTKWQVLQPHSAKALICSEYPLSVWFCAKNASGGVWLPTTSSKLADSLSCVEDILVGSLSCCLPSLSWVKISTAGVCYVQIQYYWRENHSF